MIEAGTPSQVSLSLDQRDSAPACFSGVAHAALHLTFSTTYHHPFHCARLFNALDHVTRGRIAWNAVTSAYKNEAANYGFDEMMDHDERYVRAHEFLAVAFKLRDSIEPDALVLDRQGGFYADPNKVHRSITEDIISMCAALPRFA